MNKTLPDETLFNIFKYLDNPIDLANCCQVCENWSQAAGDKRLWQKFYEEISIDNHLNTRPGMSDRRLSTTIDIPIEERTNALFIKISLNSLEELMDKVRSFSDKVKDNQRGSFKCYFSHNPGCLIDLQLSVGQVDRDRAPDIKEIFVLTKDLGPGELTRATNCGSTDTSVTLPDPLVSVTFIKIVNILNSRVTRYEIEKRNRTFYRQLTAVCAYIALTSLYIAYL